MCSRWADLLPATPAQAIHPLPPLRPHPPPDIIGLIGAIVFWPSTIYFPVAMYTKVHSPPLWQRVCMQVVNVVGFVVSVLAAVVSIRNIIQDAHTYAMFGGRR